MSGVSGVSGVGAAADGGSLFADALIRNRDGIVGTWTAPTASPAPLDLDGEHNLERWEPWVRASVLDFEMFSRIGFAKGDTEGEIAILHLETVPALVYHPLMQMVRPTSAIFQAQLDYLNQYADLRPDRAAEILAQVGQPAEFFAPIAYLRPDRSRWTLELLDAAFRLARLVEMRVKHALACRRPVELSPQVQPMILTPGHGSLPSGHSTESFMTALVLWNVLRAGGNPVYEGPGVAAQLFRQAARIAINRTVAGVHFPVDSFAGAVLGLTLGQYLVNRIQAPAYGAGASYSAWRFDGSRFPPHADFDWQSLYDIASAPRAGLATAPLSLRPAPDLEDCVKPLGRPAIDRHHQCPGLTWLWNKAVGEWA